MVDYSYTLVLITTSDDEEARLIADMLLGQRKIACANIVSGLTSLFWWRDKVDRETESLLMVKTRSDCLERLVELVKEVHSYENPEIISLPIVGGSADYLEWIDRSIDLEVEE